MVMTSRKHHWTLARRTLAGLLASLATSTLLAHAAMAQDVDSDTGLVMADGWETVKNNCTICHSAKLVTQNRGSREHWADLITWMQETQGLWEFPPEMENTILDYLSTHYGPKHETRRQNLPADLMPSSAPSKEPASSS